MSGPTVNSVSDVSESEFLQGVFYMPVTPGGLPCDREDAHRCHAWIIDAKRWRDTLLYQPMDWGTRAFMLLPNRGIFVSFWQCAPATFKQNQLRETNMRLIRHPDLDLTEPPMIVAVPQRAVYTGQ